MTRRPPARRRARALLTGALLWTLALVTIVAGLAVLGATSTPPWWNPLDPDDPRADDEGRALENRLTTGLHEADENGAVTLRITEQQAGAWLAARLPRWAANRGATGLPEQWRASVSFTPGTIRIGAQGLLAPGRTVAWVSMRPSVADDTITLDGLKLSLGAVSPPATAARALLDRHAQRLGEFAPVARDALVDGRVDLPATLAMGDSRVLHIHDITVENGAVTLRCSVERP